MKKVLSIIFLFILSTSAYSAKYDFRRLRWGMTIDRVKQIEMKSEATFLKGSNEHLSYTTYLFGYDGFYSRKLVIAKYFHYGFRVSIAQRIKLFDKVLFILKRKYGQPKIIKKGGKKIGTLMTTYSLTYNWQTKTTVIKLGVSTTKNNKKIPKNKIAFDYLEYKSKNKFHKEDHKKL